MISLSYSHIISIVISRLQERVGFRGCFPHLVGGGATVARSSRGDADVSTPCTRQLPTDRASARTSVNVESCVVVINRMLKESAVTVQ